MAVDIQRLFNEELPENLAKHPGAARQLGGTLQIEIVGEGGGSWFIDASDSGPSVTPGGRPGADATMTVDVESFLKYYENPRANGMPLLFAGKLKIIGNQALGMKLPALFELK